MQERRASGGKTAKGARQASTWGTVGTTISSKPIVDFVLPQNKIDNCQERGREVDSSMIDSKET